MRQTSKRARRSRLLMIFILVLLTRPWGLLVACAVGSSTLSIPLWGMVLLGAAGLLIFLLMMKYGDKLESALLRHFQK